MTEKSFNLKLTKKEVLVLDHGRFKGMVDLLNSVEKSVNAKMEKGEKVDQTTLIGILAAHKMQASKMLNKTSQLLSTFAEGEKAPVKKAPAKKKAAAKKE